MLGSLKTEFFDQFQRSDGITNGVNYLGISLHFALKRGLFVYRAASVEASRLSAL